MIALHEGENILAVRRKAWFVLATTVATAGFLMLVPVVLFFVLAAPTIEWISGKFIPPFLLFSAVFEWTAWLWLFVALVNYYLDVFIVTTERIIHVEQKGMFHRTTSELRLSRVQDVQVEHRGVIETLFHFGTLKVQSAAESPEFIIEQIDRPEHVKETVMAAQRNAIPREFAGRTGTPAPPSAPPPQMPPPTPSN